MSTLHSGRQLKFSQSENLSTCSAMLLVNFNHLRLPEYQLYVNFNLTCIRILIKIIMNEYNIRFAVIPNIILA